jgi:glutaredoxin 3
MKKMDIKIYTTSKCHYCHLAKEYFDKKHLTYEVINLTANPERGQEMIQLSGQMGVPVILINEKVIIGFNKEAIERAIAEDARL